MINELADQVSSRSSILGLSVASLLEVRDNEVISGAGRVVYSLSGLMIHGLNYEIENEFAWEQIETGLVTCWAWEVNKQNDRVLITGLILFVCVSDSFTCLC